MSTYATFLCGFLAAAVVYRVVCRRRPGPLPPGPKGWPIVGNIFTMPTTYQWTTFAAWGEHWGDIMSVTLLGKPVVILNSSKHASEMLDKKSSIYSSRASVPVGGEMLGWSRAMVLAPYGDRLREMRKMHARVFGSRKSVGRFHTLIEDETRRFLFALRNYGGSLSLVNKLQRLAAAIIVKISYGYSAQGDDDPIVKDVDESLAYFAKATAPGTFLADVFPILCYVPSWIPGAQWKQEVIEQSKVFDRMTRTPFEWVKGQMKTGSAPPSFASTLLESNCDPSKEELIKMAAASLYAGSADTTVSAISTFFLAMSCFPEVQRRAQAEIDAVVGQDRLPVLEDAERLPYLKALVLEVLRWIPVGPVGFPHQLTEDDWHEGYFLPKGTLVIANIWKFLHDPQTYADPMAFKPERFIVTEGGVDAERDPRDFCFGFGRRKCPGNIFAETSIFAACSMVLAVYNISKATKDGRVVEPSMRGTGTIISHPVPFECAVTIRSDKARMLLDAHTSGADVSVQLP
ncbi:cytochrome P450 [Trametes maxima]|nr:cytochrome P450 [Trametes maxima]